MHWERARKVKSPTDIEMSWIESVSSGVGAGRPFIAVSRHSPRISAGARVAAGGAARGASGGGADGLQAARHRARRMARMTLKADEQGGGFMSSVRSHPR